MATPAEAVQLIKDSKALCAMGGFCLHKIMSNSKEVLSTVAQEDLAKDIQGIDIFENDLPMERTLGIPWYVQSDAFGFCVQLDQRPAIRRSILSSVSSVFDPIGFIAPFMLTGKAILQALCRDGYGWMTPCLLTSKHVG